MARIEEDELDKYPTYMPEGKWRYVEPEEPLMDGDLVWCPGDGLLLAAWVVEELTPSAPKPKARRFYRDGDTVIDLSQVVMCGEIGQRSSREFSGNSMAILFATHECMCFSAIKTSKLADALMAYREENP